ncbi:MAG TPA: tRNA glutamyl-Q(34) synthetase GluQRS [Myxococcales bacterium]|nr:tRNA glutamyl-Q(34) synthetase GluQRS [Myxococcales bacterium]
MAETGRFAPSPTGELHLGNARTALLSWLWARQETGAWRVRVEDIDRPRVRPGMARQQLDELGWLGLDWDGEPVFQSERTARYVDSLSRLNGHIYECFCSRAEIASASAPQGDEGPRYPGTCASLTRAQRAQRRRTRTPSIRLRVPEGPLSFHDAIFGEQAFDTQRLVGDFVLRRADGVFAYQLAVVVDDAEMGVTQVLRGADLLPSTSRQILLHRLLGHPEPRWAHAPLLFADNGERLSKRDQSLSLSALRARGADPRQVVAHLARLSGLDAPEACDPRDLLGSFSLSKPGRKPVEVGQLPY